MLNGAPCKDSFRISAENLVIEGDYSCVCTVYINTMLKSSLPPQLLINVSLITISLFTEAAD